MTRPLFFSRFFFLPESKYKPLAPPRHPKTAAAPKATVRKPRRGAGYRHWMASASVVSLRGPRASGTNLLFEDFFLEWEKCAAGVGGGEEEGVFCHVSAEVLARR